MLRVYSDYYYRSYKSYYISFGSFCCLAALVLVILIPFLLLYTGPPFWIYNSIAYERPKVTFIGTEDIRVSTFDGQVIRAYNFTERKSLPKVRFERNTK